MQNSLHHIHAKFVYHYTLNAKIYVKGYQHFLCTISSKSQHCKGLVQYSTYPHLAIRHCDCHRQWSPM